MWHRVTGLAVTPLMQLTILLFSPFPKVLEDPIRTMRTQVTVPLVRVTKVIKRFRMLAALTEKRMRPQVMKIKVPRMTTMGQCTWGAGKSKCVFSDLIVRHLQSSSLIRIGSSLEFVPSHDATE